MRSGRIEDSQHGVRSSAPEDRRHTPPQSRIPGLQCAEHHGRGPAFIPTWPDSPMTSTASPARAEPGLQGGLITDDQHLRQPARQRGQGVERHRPGEPSPQRIGQPSRDFACSVGLRAITAAARELAIIDADSRCTLTDRPEAARLTIPLRVTTRR